jgi:integrase
MAAALDTRLRQAQAEKMVPIDLVSALVTDELRRRQDRLLERRHKLARFRDPELSLDTFDFDFNKKMNRALVYEFATIPLALQWADATSSSPLTARPALRLIMVRGFARYCSATDPRTEVPPVHLLPFRPAHPRPYLYTDDEIGHLLAAADQLPSRRGLRPVTYRCLLSLLIVTGLRISEARHLSPDDIDWTEGVLTIRRTKFGKSRLVPLHPSGLAALADYARRRDQLLDGRTATCFFISDRGKPLHPNVIYQTFYRLSWQTGLRSPGASDGPRLHDFRHRFALRTLATHDMTTVCGTVSNTDVIHGVPFAINYL